MRFNELIDTVAGEPVFDSALLLVGGVDAADVRSQLSRWVASGKLIRLRRGVYALAEQYRKVPLDPFVVANRLVRPSYVSLESAVGFHGLIPEYVPVVTSITSVRPQSHDTPAGRYDYRHLRTDLFWGYREVHVTGGQTALVARPEKALLDLAYLRKGSDQPSFVSELRLQSLDRVDIETLTGDASRFASKKVERFAQLVAAHALSETKGWREL